MIAFTTDQVDAYFARIGLSRPARPDRAALAAIVEAHAAAIPFEALDPLLGTPVVLESDALIDKLVRRRRGGFCFEQNWLLKGVLDALGYDVTVLTARVMWRVPPGTYMPITHMALKVALAEGPVLVDVGFGGNVLTGVLDFADGTPQETPHGPFRLVRTEDGWQQEVAIDGGWKPAHRFTEAPQRLEDCLAPSWYMATSPGSHLVHGLTCARSMPGKRLALRNFDLAIHRPGEASEKQVLPDADAICTVIARDFDIDIPDRGALIARIEQGLT